MVSSVLSDDLLNHYGAVLGVVLGCGNVDRTQVQRILEIVCSNPATAYDMLLSYVAYQEGRGVIRAETARLIVECFTSLREMKRGEKLTLDEILKVLGMAKWVHQAVSRVSRFVCRSINLRTSFSNLLKLFPDVESVVKFVLGMGGVPGAARR